LGGHFSGFGLGGIPSQKFEHLMKVSPLVILFALVVLGFTLALRLAPRLAERPQPGQSSKVMGVMVGEGRKVFANQFFSMADIYFHSGYYPSVFDQGAETQKEIIAASHGKKETEEDEKKEDFLGKTRDWVDAFGRHFKITQHTHLEGNKEREILPWIRLSADANPHKIETYTVGAFFLWEHLGQPDQAEQFLREGLRNNPNSYEILFALGRIYRDAYHDVIRARNVFELGITKFRALPAAVQKEERIAYEELVVNLAFLEEQTGHYDEALKWFELACTLAPFPDQMRKEMELIREKQAAARKAP
jgi:tetratricopeptide (TPR) repeat protein